MCGVGSYEQTSPSPRVWRLLHIQQDSRILMPCIHGVSNLEHPSRSKQVLHVQDQFFLEFVRCRLRPQTSRHYSLTSRTPCPCAIHSSKRNTQQLPSKPSAAANSTTYRAAVLRSRRASSSITMTPSCVPGPRRAHQPPSKVTSRPPNYSFYK